jgi:hypothetical protein
MWIGCLLGGGEFGGSFDGLAVMKVAAARTRFFKVKERKIRGQWDPPPAKALVACQDSHGRQLPATPAARPYERKLVGEQASRPGSSTGQLPDWVPPISDQACRACLTISPHPRQIAVLHPGRPTVSGTDTRLDVASDLIPPRRGFAAMGQATRGITRRVRLHRKFETRCRSPAPPRRGSRV